MYYLGVDIGSSSSKAALINDNLELISGKVINLGTGTKAGERVVELVLSEAGLEKKDVAYTIVTGYGRMSYKDADKQITEISCHGKGIHVLFPEARTVIDIGGQDAKCIRLGEDGSIFNFVMNEKCAAGTGRFLEVMARVLGCDISKLSDLASGSTKALSISNVCTVFAESEVISQLSAGAALEDVANGAHVSIAKRVTGMALRVGIKEKVVMTGGVALNESLRKAFEKELGCEILVPDNPQLTGAYGAAVFAKEKYTSERG